MSSCCATVVRKIPIILVVLLFLYTIYAYFIELVCFDLAEDSGMIADAAVFGCIYWLLFLLAMLCFVRAALTAPGSPPKLSQEEQQAAVSASSSSSFAAAARSMGRTVIVSSNNAQTSDNDSDIFDDSDDVSDDELELNGYEQQRHQLKANSSFNNNNNNTRTGQDDHKTAFSSPNATDPTGQPSSIEQSPMPIAVAYQGHPNNPYLFPDLMPAVTSSSVRLTRLCRVCLSVKPERCHHCSSCGACILKMDHHCPWIDNCVGFRNYKYFFLFIAYTVAFAGFMLGTTIPRLVNDYNTSDSGSSRSVIYITLIVITGLFGLATLVLLAYHSYLLAVNRTTIENISIGNVKSLQRRRRLYQQQQQQQQNTENGTSEASRNVTVAVISSGSRTYVAEQQQVNGTNGQSFGANESQGNRANSVPSSTVPSSTVPSSSSTAASSSGSKNPYNMGCANNFTQVMGDKWYQWFIPIGRPVGDGLEFPRNDGHGL